MVEFCVEEGRAEVELNAVETGPVELTSAEDEGTADEVALADVLVGRALEVLFDEGSAEDERVEEAESTPEVLLADSVLEAPDEVALSVELRPVDEEKALVEVAVPFPLTVAVEL